MPPRDFDVGFLPTEDELHPPIIEAVITEKTRAPQPPVRIFWRNVILFFFLHLASAYALVFLLPGARVYTWMWTILVHVCSALGITAGAHRLWSHRSYKAKLPYRIVLACFSSMAFQNDLIEWSRAHRCHHKYSETDADPHNAKRGFFFSHMGWLLVTEHPDAIEKGKTVDISDLLKDPVLVFQRRFYLPSVLLFCFVIPTVVPYYAWGESLWNGFFICALLRYCLSLHATWCVNSVAHIWGNRPYDQRINPAENLFVAFGAIGEGFHNYHHTFPGDYSTSEFGWKLNVTSFLIDSMAKIGLVSDRKKMSQEMVNRRKQRTGDGKSTF